MLFEENNQPLHIYWKEKIVVEREAISKSKSHIKAYKLRHEYTNYDLLINSIELQKIEALERSRIIAIIKYECTSQALQCVNGFIRDQLEEAKKEAAKFERDVIRRDGIIAAIQKLLWGNEKEIKSLKAKNQQQVLEIKSFKEEFELRKTEDQYLAEIQNWKKKFKSEQERRQQLASNNKSLGGRLSHAKRNKQKLDFVNNLLDESEVTVAQLSRDLENTKRELTEHKVLKKMYEKKILELEKKIISLGIKGTRNG